MHLKIFFSAGVGGAGWRHKGREDIIPANSHDLGASLTPVG